MLKVSSKSETMDVIKKEGIENVRLECWYGSVGRWYLVKLGERRPVTIARVSKRVSRWFNATHASDCDKFCAINVGYYKLAEWKTLTCTA